MKTYAYILSAMLAFQGAVLAADAPAAAAADAKPAAAAPAKAKASKSTQLTGAVVSTDAVGNTIVIKGKKEDATIAVSATTKIMDGKKTVALADIAAGTKVTVKFTEENGTKTASSIKIAGAAKTAKTKTDAAAPKAEAAPAAPKAEAAPAPATK
jgi:hypothetical protein